MLRDIEYAKTCLKKAQERQAAHANKSRLDIKLKAGDMVWLQDSFFENRRPSTSIADNSKRKFAPKQHGPFKVIKVLSDVTVRLELPKRWRIHDVIHTSHLRLCNDNNPAEFPGREQPPPPEPEVIDDEEHFFVEKFLARRGVGANIAYLVKWQGYGDEENVWRPLKDLREDLDPHTLEKLIQDLQARTQGPKKKVPPKTRK